MSFTAREIEKIILETLSLPEYAAEFDVKTLENALFEQLKPENDSEKSRIRREMDMVLRADGNYFASHDKAFPKQAFFKDTLFRMEPSTFELSNGILLSGARFAAFANPDVFPDDYTIKSGDIEIAVITFQMPFKALADAFFMLGKSGLIDYLSAEHNDNFARLRSSSDIDNEPMIVSVYDMEEFYAKNSFRQGDAVTGRVVDRDECVFELIYAPSSEAPDEALKNAWITSFEGALLKVCEAETDYPEIPFQISDAYFYAYLAGTDIRFTPYVSLEEYRHKMREIAIRRDGSEWLLVSADDTDTPGQFEQTLAKGREQGKSHEHSDESCASCHGEKRDDETADDGNTQGEIRAEDFGISEGDTSSLDAILSDMDSPVNTTELYAMILDDLANGNENFEDFRVRVCDIIHPKFADDGQETAFINFIEDNWETVKADYNPRTDAAKEPLRSRLLDLTYSRIEMSIMLLERYAEKGVPREIVNVIANVHRDIIDTLSLLNGDTDFEGSDSDLEQLELRVGDIEDKWDDFLDASENLI